MAEKRKSAVLLTDKELQKRYPDCNVTHEIEVNDEEPLKLPCRVITINHHLGGGISYGKIVESIGEESTGKTLLAMDFGIVAQSMGGVVLWDDAECTFDIAWAKKNGLDVSKDKLVLFKYENKIEVISDWINDMVIYWRSKLVNNEPILLVIDSLAVLETVEAMDTAEVDTKAEMGRRSFKMGQMLRKRTSTLSKYGVSAFFINQIRTKLATSMFEDNETTPLAQCMKYYAAQRFGLYRGKRIRENDAAKGKWVGNYVYLRTKKNKTGPPRDNVKAKVYFVPDQGKPVGYDKYYGLEELLVEKGIVKRKKGVFSYKGKVIAKGEEKFILEIANNDELRKKFIKKLGINTPSKFRERLEGLDKNLFPVKLKEKKKKDEDQE